MVAGETKSTREVWWIGALGLAVFLAYQPVWNAGFIWDDEGHLTAPWLRSWRGLWAIWTVPGASQQYYPLLHSVFWVMNRLVGQEPWAYHVLTIALHAASAGLVFLVLRRLQARGALLAAAIFALHPVMVESVAWVAELKNTLSAFFYLSAGWVYLRYDQEKRPGDYLLAFGLFFAALLTKTVTASLPAALLVVFWWKRGRVDVRRDVGPLLPFFVAGVILGLFTASVERHFIGASGSNFDFSLAERGLIAGRALFFYAGKLAWPADLVFVYPRWEITSAQWTQFLWPAAAVVVLAGLIGLTRWRRGPLAGGLIFAGTLFPALGFFNVFPFQYSFVADHFQYLASLGLIVPFAWAASELVRSPRARFIAGGGLVLTLAGLTWRQSRAYDDVVSLYVHTLEVNPRATLAHVNLANLYFRAGQVDEAARHYHRAIELTPHDPLAYYNRGVLYAAQGRLDDARTDFETTLQNDPKYAPAHLNLGSVLTQQGNVRRAVGHVRQAAYLQPFNSEARRALGRVLLDLGYADEAVVELQRALTLDPYDQQTVRLLEAAELRARQR